MRGRERMIPTRVQAGPREHRRRRVQTPRASQKAAMPARIPLSSRPGALLLRLGLALMSSLRAGNARLPGCLSAAVDFRRLLKVRALQCRRRLT